MAFIEAVFGEFFHQVEDFRGDFPGNTVLDGAFNKLFFVTGNDLLFLLAHGFSEVIRLGQFKPRHVGGNTHHLLLIEDDAVGIF
ncbi:hypothetical protein DSECCO2_616190 [anaerobic digester metagenome]